MSSPEESRHDYFEELSALAALGQIAESELVELKSHVETCARCRSVSTDFVDLLHNRLPLLDPEVRGPSKLSGLFSRDSSYRERFLARARRQGFVVETAPPGANLGIRPRSLRRYAWSAVFALGLLLAAVVGLANSLIQSNARYTRLRADVAELNERLRLQNSHPETSPSQSELVKARLDLSAAEARLKTLEEQLQAASLDLQALRGQRENESSLRGQLEKKLSLAEEAVARASDDLDVIRGQLEKKLSLAEAAVARANDDLDVIRRARAQDLRTMTAQSREIAQLSDKLDEQTKTLALERELLKADRHVRDLLGARNLHIVDVWEVDSKGKDKRAFARAFFAEARLLIFYAYDLGDRSSTRRNASFQLWGTQGSKESSVRSLGILYVDDQNQNRWKLSFDDPKVLAEIDTVFVTVEPSGGSTKPTTSTKFLYAYLKATDANHP